MEGKEEEEEGVEEGTLRKVEGGGVQRGGRGRRERNERGSGAESEEEGASAVTTRKMRGDELVAVVGAECGRSCVRRRRRLERGREL
jgi:hypothetical protein